MPTGFGTPEEFGALGDAGEPNAVWQRDVRIEVGAAPAELAPVRVLAADLVTRADFDLAAVADLRIAVEEACSALTMVAPRGNRLHCLLTVRADRITVTVQVAVPDPVTIPRDGFGWHVLATLADEVTLLDGDGLDAAAIGIRLVKYRAPVVL